MNHKNEITRWARKCPKCGGTIYHHSQKDRDRREKEGRTCGGKTNKNCKVISKTQRRKLSEAITGMVYVRSKHNVSKSTPAKWVRNCPKCRKIIEYRGKLEHYERAVKLNSLCFSCTAIIHNFQKNRVNKNSIRKMRATKAGFKSWSEYCRMFPKWKRYKADVWRHTYKSLRDNPTLENFHLRGKCGVKGAYQIDHITSVRYGFDNGIDPSKIGEFSNLRMIPWRDNLLKG